jgi:hypothetical protein
MICTVTAGRPIPAVAAAGILLNVHKILSSLKSYLSLMCNFRYSAWDLRIYLCKVQSLEDAFMEYKLSQICG